MPKDDQEKLKADCDDGFTRITNLILEAMAIAKLTKAHFSHIAA